MCGALRRCDAMHACRNEHAALDLRVRDARADVDAYKEDEQGLTMWMHGARAGRDDGARRLVGLFLMHACSTIGGTQSVACGA